LALCVTYEASGTDGFVYWTDCSGNPQEYEITVFEVYTFCALEDTVTTTGLTYNITSLTCEDPPTEVFCDCGGGCSLYAGTTCPVGCTPC